MGWRLLCGCCCAAAVRLMMRTETTSNKNQPLMYFLAINPWSRTSSPDGARPSRAWTRCTRRGWSGGVARVPLTDMNHKRHGPNARGDQRNVWK